MEFRKAYDNHSERRVSILFEDESRAEQSSLEETDINTIVRRFGLTGQLPTGLRAPTYGDYLEVSDYHTAMNAIAQANEAFEQMPADIRTRFDNDPGKFVDFCSNEANAAEAAKLGLVMPKAAELAQSAVDVTTPATVVAETPT